MHTVQIFQQSFSWALNARHKNAVRRTLFCLQDVQRLLSASGSLTQPGMARSRYVSTGVEVDSTGMWCLPSGAGF
jgi:hypothetical protein